MDAAATMSRVDAIQSMISQLVGGAAPTPAAPTTTSTAPTSFAATLQSATAPTATTATDRTAAPATTTLAAAPTATTTAATAATPTTLGAGGAAVPYAAQITAAAQANGIDPALLAGLIKQESGFNPTIASSAGAVGLTQLMPGTAASLGVTDPTDPTQSINGGARYLAQQLKTFGGDTTKALAAYNAGPGAVEQYGGVPPYPETQNYVKSVLANAAQYEGAQTTA
jgi:soluble lytic murein transglycosylase-like protein